MATQVGNIIFSISADLKQVQGQLRTLEGNFQSSVTKISSLGKSIASSLGFGLSVAGAVAFGKEVIALGGYLDDLSKQTGLSVQTLSGLKSTLEENGTSLDAFAKGVFLLQKNLGEIKTETDPAAQAIKSLGLNLNELRNLPTEEFVRKVTTALAGIENPVQRAAVASALLSRSARELIPAFLELAGKFDELRAKGMNEDTVKRLDAIGDALTRLKNQALLLGGEGAVALLKFFGVIPAAPAEDLGKIQMQIDQLAYSISKLTGISTGRLEGMQRIELFNLLRDPSLSEHAKDLVNRLIALRDRAQEVTGTLSKPITAKPFQPVAEGADKAKLALESFLEGLQGQANQMRVNIVSLGAGERAALELGLAFQYAAFRAKLLAEGKAVPAGADEAFKKLSSEIMGLSDALAQAKLNSDLLKQSLEEADKAFPEPGGITTDQLPPGLAGQGGGILTEDQFKQLQTLEEEVKKFERGLTEGLMDEKAKRAAIVNDEYDERIAKIREWYAQGAITEEKMTDLIVSADALRLKELQNQTDEVTTFMERSFERMQDAIGDAFKDLLSGQIKGWGDLGRRIGKVISDITAEWLAMQAKIAIFGPSYGAPGGQIGGLIGSIAGLFGAGGTAVPNLNAPGTTFSVGGSFPMPPFARQSGGYVIPGQQYLVGENGTERFIPNMAGRIDPAGKRGGGLTVSGPIMVVQTPDANSFRQAGNQIQADMFRALSMASKRLGQQRD